jgi:preprotein translocase subunit SecG
MITRIKIWATIAGLFVTALVMSFLSGKKTAEDSIEKEELKDYKETRKRIDAVPKHTDVDSAREWLRKRGE